MGSGVRASTVAALATVLCTSLCLTVGLVISVCACAFWVWWPMFILLLFTCGVCPNFIFGFSYAKAEADELILGVNSSSRFTYVGNFLSAFFVVSAVGLGFVLKHAEVINWGGCVLGIVGGWVVYCTIMLYIQVFFWFMGRGKGKDDEFDEIF